MRGWHERYGDQGLVVVGIHYPELANERDLGNLTEAVEHLGIPYAITQDNERETWGAYGIRYWPTLVLVDRRGRIRFQHIGEGRYEEIEQAIQLLLDES